MKYCKKCGSENPTYSKNYCSHECKYYRSPEHREKIRQIGLNNKGRFIGEKNPNFGGKYINDPIIKKKYLIAVQERGQSWNKERCQEHSKLMKTAANWMTGKTHSNETKNSIAKTKKQQYENGEIILKRIKISKAEKEIVAYLKTKNINVVPQFYIKGVSFIYDFYFPDFNLIVEYNGDYWHANPSIYKDTSKIFNFPKKKMTIFDIWNKDSNKKMMAENHGYNFKIIWETDYKKYGLSTIDKILNII